MKKVGLIFLFVILLIPILSYGQTDSSGQSALSSSDKDEKAKNDEMDKLAKDNNIPTTPREDISWYDPDKHKIHHIITVYSRDGVPAPTPVDDSRDHDNKNDGSVNQSIDNDFDQTIDQSTESSVGLSRRDPNHERPDRENYSQSKSGNYQTRGSHNYQELVAKGYLAEQIIKEKASNVSAAKSASEEVLENTIEKPSDERLEEAYSQNINLISEENVKKIANVIFDYSQSQIAFSPAPFQDIVLKNQTDYNAYKEKMAQIELSKLLPGVHEKNISDLIRAREVIQNWKTAESILNDDIFDDFATQANDAIVELQKNVNATYVGPVESKFVKYIQSLEGQSQLRLTEYVSNLLKDIHRIYGTNSIPYDVVEAIRLLNEASASITQSQDYFSAANKILQANTAIKGIDQVEESQFGPDDLILGVATVGGIAKGLSENIFQKVLKNVATSEDRAIIRKLAAEYTNLKPGQYILHDAENPGILHYSDVSNSLKVAGSFKNQTYIVRLSESEEIIERYYDGVSSNILGNFFTKDGISSKVAVDQLALRNEPIYRATFKLPKNMLVFEGNVADMNYGNGIMRPGGGNQIYMDIEQFGPDNFMKFLKSNTKINP